MLHYCFKHCDCDINRSSLHCYNEEIDNLKSTQDPWSIIYYLLFITSFASRSRMKMASWRSACRMRYTKCDKEFVLRNVYSYKRAFKRHAVSSLEELQSVVNESSVFNSTQFVGSFVPVADWQRHLAPFYRPAPGVKGCQHVRSQLYDSQPYAGIVAPQTVDVAMNSQT